MGGGQHSTASDVFSFGVVMWELLTWQMPWVDDVNGWSIVSKTQQGERLAIPDMSYLPGGPGHASSIQGYVELMEKCWAQDPAERPSFGAVASTLRSLM